MRPTGAALMRIISRAKLREFWKVHADSEGSLLTWHELVEDADWGSPLDVRDTIRSADTVGDEFVVFNICKNDYRLVVRVDYRRGIVYVWGVYTHQEYDRLDLRAIEARMRRERETKRRER